MAKNRASRRRRKNMEKKLAVLQYRKKRMKSNDKREEQRDALFNAFKLMNKIEKDNPRFRRRKSASDRHTNNTDKRK